MFHYGIMNFVMTKMMLREELIGPLQIDYIISSTRISTFIPFFGGHIVVTVLPIVMYVCLSMGKKFVGPL